MKIFTGALAASMISLAAATAAHAASKSYAVADFTRISVAAGIEAKVSVGGDYSVVAEGSAEGLERLDVKVANGELSLHRKNKPMQWKRHDHVSVQISLPALNGLEISSGASVDAAGVDAEDFDIDVSSGGGVAVAGKCGDLSVDVSSGGDIDARDLKCRTANADASSGGSADIFASQSVSADASSGGGIEVFGAPKTVDKDAFSGGNIRIRN